MTNDTSRPSANGTTARVVLAADGSPATVPESLHDSVWKPSIRDRLWDLKTSVKHRLGVHTFVTVELWRLEDGVAVFEIIREECWLCPARR